MKLFIDDAHLDAIRKIYDLYPVDGVTTNPSILKKAGGNPIEVLKSIREFIGDDILFAQANDETAEGLVEDAHFLIDLLGKEHTVIKVPSVPEGFKAIRMLHAEGIRTCGTIVYSPMQAYMAGKSGAEYVAPYVNRVDNLGYDGVAVTESIEAILEVNDLPTEVLAASFHTSQQVLDLCAYGIGNATCSPDIIEGLVKSASVEQAAAAFTSDLEALTGRKTMREI